MIASSYTRYEQNDREKLESQVLNSLQKENIQNLICDEAEARISLILDPEHPLLFAQQEAAIAGRIGILRYILESSAASEQTLLEAARDNDEI